MFRKLTLSLLVLCFYGVGLCQNCTAPFADAGSGSGTGFNETCNVSGPDNYTITVTAASDSVLAFNGLYRELGTILADVDCNSETFTIAAQWLFQGYYITGSGSHNSNAVNIVYTVHKESDSTALETCTGTYLVTPVGIAAQTQGPRTYLYPNPAREQAVLHVSGSDAESLSYRVLDLQGRKVVEGGLDGDFKALIDVRGLAKGIYTVVVRDLNGQVGSRLLSVQ